MNRPALLLFIILLLTGSAYACPTETKLMREYGIRLYNNKSGVPLVPHTLKTPALYRSDLVALENIKEPDHIEYLLARGVLLIMLQEYSSAIKTCLEAERLAPGRYTTAVNISFAYELKGETEKALHWLQRAVTIEPQRMATECIHIRLLEAKLKGEQYYTSNFLLHTDFGKGYMPRSTLSQNQWWNLENAMDKCLLTRLTFFAPPDEATAALLFDYGNLLLLDHEFDYARRAYTLAKKYGYNHPPINKRLMRSRIHLSPAGMGQALVMALVALAIMVALIIIYRRGGSNVKRLLRRGIIVFALCATAYAILHWQSGELSGYLLVLLLAIIAILIIIYRRSGSYSKSIQKRAFIVFALCAAAYTILHWRGGEAPWFLIAILIGRTPAVLLIPVAFLWAFYYTRFRLVEVIAIVFLVFLIYPVDIVIPLMNKEWRDDFEDTDVVSLRILFRSLVLTTIITIKMARVKRKKLLVQNQQQDIAENEQHDNEQNTAR